MGVFLYSSPLGFHEFPSALKLQFGLFGPPMRLPWLFSPEGRPPYNKHKTICLHNINVRWTIPTLFKLPFAVAAVAQGGEPAVEPPLAVAAAFAVVAVAAAAVGAAVARRP